MELQQVNVGHKALADYATIASRGLMEQLKALAEPLAGKRVLHLSATAFGGGVAEILYTLVPLMRDAGLDMAGVTVLESEGGYAHLLVRRFDVVDGRRLHQHTLGGLLHVDYNDVGASSYEEYLRTALTLGLPPAAIEEA